VSRLALALLLAWALSACQTPPPAPVPPTHAEIVRGELSQLLADQPSCGAVRLYSRRGKLDYRVECDSGQVYRVRVSADGRVLITPYTGN